MTSEFRCPVCGEYLTKIIGDGIGINADNGILLKCYNMKCDTTENVFGHSNTEKNAYEVVKLKFKDCVEMIKKNRSSK